MPATRYADVVVLSEEDAKALAEAVDEYEQARDLTPKLLAKRNALFRALRAKYPGRNGVVSEMARIAHMDRTSVSDIINPAR